VSIAKRVEKRAINPADFEKNLEDFFAANRLRGGKKLGSGVSIP
jgi:hypothetical protein